MTDPASYWPPFGLTLTTPRLGIWHEDNFIGCQDIAAKDFAMLKTQDVQKVHLTPATFDSPAWQLQVRGHEALAKYLGLPV